MIKVIQICICLLILSSGYCQVPDGYYDSADDLEGEQLKIALYNIIKGHVEYPYTSSTTDTWDILKETDRDPNNSENVIGIYSGFSMNAAAEYNNGDGWTREHVWAKSRGDFGTDPGPGTDVHHLRAEDNSTNSARSNRTFAECNEPYIDEEGSYQGETGSFLSNSDFIWEPRSEVKGDIARMIFYMATRYEGENGEPDLEIVDYVVEQYSTLAEHGKLTDLLIWHTEDPVDEYEINRNDIIYSYQGNRNPYIDHPEYVALIWGDITGPFVSVDKKSMNTDFGAVSFGEYFVQEYSLNSYNLEGDVTVQVEDPFYVSVNGTDFSNSLVLSHSEGQITESFDIYLKFEPQQDDDLSYNVSVIHSSVNMTSVELEVVGKEGVASLVTIAQARVQDLSSVVNVTGVIIGGENNSSSSRVLYDETAGIVIRSPDGEINETSSLELGDSVVVSGALTDYNGLLQVNGSPMSVTLISKNAELPDPKELTIDEINESYESQLVIIKGVTFLEAGSIFEGGGSVGNFDISDGTGTLIFRLGNANHPLAGATVPSGKYDVTGYISQFGDDYQISPRLSSDLVAVVEDQVPLETISIADARAKSEGSIVQVKGIVIGGPLNNSINRVIYDGTAGIVIRSSELGNSTEDLELGDSVLVSGGLLDYNGLLEIEQAPISIELLNSGNDLPQFQPIGLEDIGEEYESELVTLDGLTFNESGIFQAGDYTLTNQGMSLIFRLGSSDHSLIGISIPEGEVTISGYVEQSGSDYRLLINDVDNLEYQIPVVTLGTAEMVSRIYPNPVEDQLHIKSSEYSTLKMYDLSGNLILSTELSEGRPVDVKSYTKGVYVVHLMGRNVETKVVKIFKK